MGHNASRTTRVKQYRHDYKRRTRHHVEVGTNIWSGEPTYHLGRIGFGSTIIAGPPRSGKTQIMKLLYVAKSKVRPTFLLDFMGEHSMNQHPNWLSESYNTDYVEDMLVINNFKFKIRQFSNKRDWLSLGFPDGASQLMAHLARQYHAHRNDPELFYEMVKALPTDRARLAWYREQYGVEVQAQHVGTATSCKARYNIVHADRFFADSTDTDLDFGKLALDNRHVVVNLRLHMTDLQYARAKAGKALEQVKNVLHLFRVPPCIVIEEADKLAPNPGVDDVGGISSMLMLVDMVMKYQKMQMELIFVTQNAYNLHPDILKFHTELYEAPGENSVHPEITRKMHWDIEANYREFLLTRPGSKGYEVFVPADSPTLY